MAASRCATSQSSRIEWQGSVRGRHPRTGRGVSRAQGRGRRGTSCKKRCRSLPRIAQGVSATVASRFPGGGGLPVDVHLGQLCHARDGTTGPSAVLRPDPRDAHNVPVARASMPCTGSELFAATRKPGICPRASGFVGSEGCWPDF